jgi:ArsR family transcriptional regulator, arsenate/arsenite/antimonite-responsive transcriptional repressor
MLRPEKELLSASKKHLASMFRALGNPTRFLIMEILSEKQIRMTSEIVEDVHLAPSTVSQHLKILLEAGLVQVEIRGPASFYSVNLEGVHWLKEQVAHWLPEYVLPED